MTSVMVTRCDNKRKGCTNSIDAYPTSEFATDAGWKTLGITEYGRMRVDFNDEHPSGIDELHHDGNAILSFCPECAKSGVSIDVPAWSTGAGGEAGEPTKEGGE